MRSNSTEVVEQSIAGVWESPLRADSDGMGVGGLERSLRKHRIMDCLQQMEEPTGQLWNEPLRGHL